jgi:hypothetical protein
VKPLELFPLSTQQLFKLPDLAVDAKTKADTYKGLFLNELLALETSARRNLAPATYIRHADGSANMSLPDTILDVSTFYLFAHKTLVSAIFIFAKTLPHDKARGITYQSYTTFANKVHGQGNDVYKAVYESCGKNLSWAQKAIIDKRDDLVQHWQGNSSNKFFTSIYAWDLPLLVYYDPKAVDAIDGKQVDFVYAQVKPKVKAQLDPAADAMQKIVWLEAWHPTLSRQLQQQVESLLNNDKFIALPITPHLVQHLDTTIASLLEAGLQ